MIECRKFRRDEPLPIDMIMHRPERNNKIVHICGARLISRELME